MEDKENFPCPDCGQQTMQLIEDQELLRCNNCNLELTLDTYAMSLQIAQKELIIQALKLFLEPGTGRCIKYNNKYYNENKQKEKVRKHIWYVNKQRKMGKICEY